MDSNQIVKVGLSGSHLQGHPESLSHFASVWSEVVKPDNFLLKEIFSVNSVHFIILVTF